jgi:hypothetical protein
MILADMAGTAPECQVAPLPDREFRTLFENRWPTGVADLLGRVASLLER